MKDAVVVMLSGEMATRIGAIRSDTQRSPGYGGAPDHQHDIHTNNTQHHLLVSSSQTDPSPSSTPFLLLTSGKPYEFITIRFGFDSLNKSSTTRTRSEHSRLGNPLPVAQTTGTVLRSSKLATWLTILVLAQEVGPD
jgi:hypothetical protein